MMRLGGGVLVDLPTSKPSFTAFILWRLFVMSGDDCEAASAAVTNGSLRASRRMDKSFRLFVIFLFFAIPFVNETVYYAKINTFCFKK
jgi:hypothetical protein